MNQAAKVLSGEVIGVGIIIIMFRCIYFVVEIIELFFCAIYKFAIGVKKKRDLALVSSRFSI